MGIAAMTFSPPTRPFLSSKPELAASAILFGAPLDLTESFRPGTAAAPTRIRLVSDSLETYSPRLRRDLDRLAFADWGDLLLEGLSLEAALESVEAAISRAASAGFPLVLGGEHTLTLAAVKALARHYPDLLVLQLDAHLDLIEEYEGRRVCHATVMRRVAELLGPQAIVQLGVRSGTRQEWEFARWCLFCAEELALPQPVREQLVRRPVYLSLDIDVLDPAFAPGTGCAEPGGATFRELLEFLYSLEPVHVVGADIVEVLPAIDPADITAIAAAKLVRELLLLFGAACD